eukprot:4189624-Karenia_brevis.AAC.1
MDEVVYEKYSSELYGMLVLLVDGEPLGISRGLQDTRLQYDGFKAVVTLNQRFVVKTSSSTLASFLEVVSPGGLKDKDLVAGVHQWERRAADLRTRFGEEIKGSLKLAVF